MAICTICGAIVSEDLEDQKKHICNSFFVPTKGRVKQPKVTELTTAGEEVI